MRGLTRRVQMVAWAGLAGATLVLIPALGAGSAGAKGPSPSLAHARTELLKLSDMPKGWTSTKSSNGNGQFPGESQLASCIGVPVSVVNLNPPSVNSPEFDNKDQSQTVDDNVAVFSSSKVAKQQYNAIGNAKTPGCYQQLANGPLKSQIDSAFGSGSTVGTMTVKASAPIKGTAGFTLAFTVVVQGVSVPVSFGEVFAIKGNQGAQLSFDGIGLAFPSSLEKSLTTLALHRL